jgi:hypothetical protein
MGGFLRFLGEGRADGGRHHLPLLGTDVGQRVPHEVHAAALPGGAEYLSIGAGS